MQHKFKKITGKSFQGSTTYKNKGIHCIHFNTEERKTFYFPVVYHLLISSPAKYNFSGTKSISPQSQRRHLTFLKQNDLSSPQACPSHMSFQPLWSTDVIMDSARHLQYKLSGTESVWKKSEIFFKKTSACLLRSAYNTIVKLVSNI